eukprot:CAMPEP_0170582910 /NCGR_PEP_ID=MMETSP0224-20130122/7840_1 /TAXON_ID=285029 /ORGANISM="Togula jolla, Strain CCCM 725" /LENGTH=222 /DNA_ID=CAMNT_0010906175 /DNA_START=255 /DNA_END=924 /DNA_ORIENTATION=-
MAPRMSDVAVSCETPLGPRGYLCEVTEGFEGQGPHLLPCGPEEACSDGFHVRGGCRNAVFAGMEVDHEVIQASNPGRPLRSLLEVQDEQQHGILAEASHELGQELLHESELASAVHSAHEQNRAAPRIDGLEALDPAHVPLTHAGVPRVVVPERVMPRAIHDHVACRVRITGGVVEEALEVRTHEVEQTLHAASHPVKGQRLRATSELLEGELWTTGATQGN